AYPRSPTKKDLAASVGTAVLVEDVGAFLGYQLRLMPPMNDPGGLPPEGRGLIAAALVGRALQVRIFDKDGQRIADTDESQLSEQAGPIDDLKKQLEGLWPPHALTESEKARVIESVVSITGLGDYFFVTAYHVVRDATSVTFNLGGDYI